MGNPGAHTSQLLLRWHSGDRDALMELLDRHLPAIRERIHHRLGPLLRKGGDTNDYLQDAVLEFFDFAPRFVVGSEEQLRGLLVRIVDNLLCDKHDWYSARRRALARERPLPPTTLLRLDEDLRREPDPSDAAERHEREAWVRLGIELLEPRDREAIVLREWDGLSFPDLGERLGVSEDAARMRYNRAFARLTEIIGAMRRGRVPAEGASPDPRGEAPP